MARKEYSSNVCQIYTKQKDKESNKRVDFYISLIVMVLL